MNLTIVNDVSPPRIVSAVSRKVHRNAGVFDIAVGNASPGIECRTNGITTLLVVFDEEIKTAGQADDDVILTSNSMVNAGTVTQINVTGPTLSVEITDMDGLGRVRFAFPGITDQAGNSCSETLCASVLTGDVNQDLYVNVTDLLPIKNQLNQQITTTSFYRDINTDGVINVLDLLASKADMNLSLIGTTCP
jgi:hypothetical protein